MGAPAGFPGRVLRGAWLPFCSREWSGEAAFATRRRFQSGFTQVRDAPRPSQAAARCRSAERAPCSVGTWLHGRGCGSWALSPPGHHPPPLLLLRLPHSLRGRDHREARTMVRGGSGALWNRTSVCRGACVFFHGSQVSLVWATSLAGACRELGPCSMWRCLVVTGLPRFIRVLSRLILDGFSCSHSESIVLWVLERRG